MKTFYMGVSKNKGTPKSSILIGVSIINHSFWGTPIFGNTHIRTMKSEFLLFLPYLFYTLHIGIQFTWIPSDIGF